MELDLHSYSTELINKLSRYCKDYFTDCLHNKKGFNVMYRSDQEDNTKFDHYLSTNYELNTLVEADLSKEESVTKIVFALDCKRFNNYSKDEIIEMSYNMAFVLFGIISGLTLFEQFKLENDTEYFVKKSLN